MAQQMVEQKIGLLDLEKELTCSICTEILYQPLSLIDCLHTFCGSCLKIWFRSQAALQSHSSPRPFTCPSCRSTVLRTKHDSKVQTLVDMFLQANPTQEKGQEEVEDIRKKYTPGEDVLQVTGSGEPEDEDDRRMVEAVRAISLQEVGLPSPRTPRSTRTYERGIRHEARTREERRREHRSAAERTAELESQARQIEHQPSLRSLISNSDLHSAEMQEEILRQITDEGLLDGIDLNNMTVAQEDELSERIAEAYRRRHRHRAHVADRPSEDARIEPDVPRSPDRRSRRSHSRSASATEQTTAAAPTAHSSSAQRSPRNTSPNTSHPPVSRPHLLEARPQGSTHPRRRTASEGRRQTSPIPAGNAVRGEAARSATDLSNRPRSSESRTAVVAAARESRTAETAAAATRRTTEPRTRRLSSENTQRQYVAPLVTVVQNPISTQLPHAGTSQQGVQRALGLSQMASPTAMTPASPRLQSESRSNQRPFLGQSASDTHQPANAGHGSSNTSRSRLTVYSEPSISCERCGRSGIQYELHERCSVCKDGNYHLCHLCYRRGEGCLLWYGFGSKAYRTFQAQAEAAIYPGLPHTLTGSRYGRPPPESIRTSPPSVALTTTSNPATRLETGVFCSLCSARASDCFWRCSTCNEGEWGFCSSCVHKGHHCTHPLLPIAAWDSIPPSSPAGLGVTYPPCNLSPSGRFCAIAPPTTTCASCSKSIAPQEQRHHCPTCSTADADFCLSCYARLAAAGTVEPVLRRCPLGHRTVMVRFVDDGNGWRREVVRDRAGGGALHEESGASIETDLQWRWREGGAQSEEMRYRTISKVITDLSASARTTTSVNTNVNTTNFTASGNVLLPELNSKSSPRLAPPDGGVGMRVFAHHGWWLPASASGDDLLFPRGAEIREVEAINDEWYWGFYCGFSGTFPANHVRVLGADHH